MLALLNTLVTHRGWREWYYRPCSASLPRKLPIDSFGQRFSGDSLWCAAVQTASGAPCGEEPVGSLTFHLSSSWGTLKMSVIVYSQGIQPWQSCWELVNRVVKMQQDVTVVSSLVIVNNSATLQLLFSAICLQSRECRWMSELMNYFGGAITLPPNPANSACRKGIPFWVPCQLSRMYRVRALVPKTWIHPCSQKGSRITCHSKSKDGWRGGQETCCYFFMWREALSHQLLASENTL